MIVYGESNSGGSVVYDSPLYIPVGSGLVFDAPLINGGMVFGNPTYVPGPDPDPIIGMTAVHAHEAEPGRLSPAGPINTRRVVRIVA